MQSHIFFILAFACLSGASSPNECCVALRESEFGISSITLSSESTSYHEVISAFWPSQAQDDAPACIVQPSNADSVASAVKVLAQNDCKFSIKSGGHGSFAGSSSINDGITIDLSRLDTISVDKSKGVAYIGAGLRWGSIYEYVQTQGMMVCGARISSVGIGGLILGGGISWFIPQKGWVADTVKNFEVVTGTGDIINVNETSNADLFAGLKGGSNNFGIVTRFDLEAFPFDKMWGGVMFHPPSKHDDLIDVFTHLTDNIAGDPKATFINGRIYQKGSGITLYTALDYVEPVEAPAVFSEVLAIPDRISSTLRITDLKSLADELETSLSANERTLFLTATIDNDAAMLKNAVTVSDRHLEEFKNATSLFRWVVIFQPILRITSDQSVVSGGNIMGMEQTQNNLINVLIWVSWTEASDDQKLTDASYAAIHEMTDVAKQLGVHNPSVYLNYAGKRQDPLAGYGAENLQKMRLLSKKYDPAGVFQTLVEGGFKIPGMQEDAEIPFSTSPHSAKSTSSNKPSPHEEL